MRRVVLAGFRDLSSGMSAALGISHSGLILGGSERRLTDMHDISFSDAVRWMLKRG